MSADIDFEYKLLKDHFLTEITRLNTYKITNFVYHDINNTQLYDDISKNITLPGKIDITFENAKPKIRKMVTNNGFYKTVDNYELINPNPQPKGKGDIQNHIFFPKEDKFSSDIINELANTSHKYFTKSRFFNDINYSHEVAIEIYKNWIINSFNGYASYIFINYNQDDDINGYATIIEKAEQMILDLIVIFNQGKGIGTSLINDIIKKCHQTGKEFVTGTQTTNIPAIRFYIKNGFKIKKIKENFSILIK